MIKSMLKFSLLIYIMASNFVWVIAKDIEAQKPSIARRAVEWARANPAKTIAIAAVIGGGIYGGHRLYKYSQEKELKEKQAVFKEHEEKERQEKIKHLFADAENNPEYQKLPEEEKQAVVKEHVDFFNWADSLTKKGLAIPISVILSATRGSKEDKKNQEQIVAFVNKKLANELKSAKSEDERKRIRNNVPDQKIKPLKKRIKQEKGNEFKQKYSKVIKYVFHNDESEFWDAVAYAEFLSE